ncbi:MAG: HlyD family efflux transporter periplasmic adaptor subunit [Pseudomonadota bacterium]
MKRIVTHITAVFLATAISAALPDMANAESASSAVKTMTDDAHKAAARKHIDPQMTGSVRSANAFDARGVVVPNAEVTLGAGLAAKISEMPYKAGQGFRRGDLLVAFDCARQLADLRGAKATMGKAASFYKSKKRLKERGAAGSQEVFEAAADVANAKAAVDGLTEVLSLCKIEAPFNGRVVERHAETYEIPAPNAPVLTVVDDSALELDLIVPSKWLRWMKVGSTFDFNVDELGQNYRARVARLGAKVDAVSQTIKLTGTFVARPTSVLAGMSGTAKFEAPSNLSN